MAWTYVFDAVARSSEEVRIMNKAERDEIMVVVDSILTALYDIEKLNDPEEFVSRASQWLKHLLIAAGVM